MASILSIYYNETLDGSSSSEWDVASIVSRIALVALLFVLPFFYMTSSNNKTKGVPPPPPVCSAGILETAGAIANGRMCDFLLEQFLKFGPIYQLRLSSVIPTVPMMAVVVCPETAREVYKEPGHIKPWILYRHSQTFAGDQDLIGLEGRAGDSYWHRRKAMNVAFAPKQVQRMNDITLQVVQQWIKDSKLDSLGEDNSSVSLDIGREMIKITIDVVCQAGFNYTPTEEEKVTLLEEMNAGWEEFTLKTAFNPLRSLGTWMLPERRRAYRLLQFLQEFCQRLVDNYHATKDTTDTSGTIINCIMENPDYQSDSERYADIIMTMMAGHDTTGFTIAFTLLELAKSPKEQQKLRQELLSTNRSDDTPVFLKHVAKESMRLHPVVPIAGFKQLCEDVITKPGHRDSPQFLLPKGSILVMAQAAMARDPLVFENPNDFQPSRWEDPTEDQKRACFPFSLGKRNCVGQAMAIAEIYVVLSQLIREYQFTVQEEGQVKNPSTLRLENCILKVSKAKKE